MGEIKKYLNIYEIEAIKKQKMWKGDGLTDRIAEIVGKSPSWVSRVLLVRYRVREITKRNLFDGLGIPIPRFPKFYDPFDPSKAEMVFLDELKATDLKAKMDVRCGIEILRKLLSGINITQLLIYKILSRRIGVQKYIIDEIEYALNSKYLPKEKRSRKKIKTDDKFEAESLMENQFQEDIDELCSDNISYDEEDTCDEEDESDTIMSDLNDANVSICKSFDMYRTAIENIRTKDCKSCNILREENNKICNRLDKIEKLIDGMNFIGTAEFVEDIKKEITDRVAKRISEAFGGIKIGE